MSEVNDPVNGGESTQEIPTESQTVVTPESTASPKEIEVNGRKYTPEQFDVLAKDTSELVRKMGDMSRELGELRKLKETPVEPKKDDVQLDPMVAANAKKVFKDLGFITKEEQAEQEYFKQATSEIKKVAEKYGVKPEEFAKELDQLGVRVPVEKIESIYKANHADEYLAWREKEIAREKPKTPYTERSAKEGLELPLATKPKLGENVVSQALELLGVKE